MRRGIALLTLVAVAVTSTAWAAPVTRASPTLRPAGLEESKDRDALAARLLSSRAVKAVLGLALVAALGITVWYGGGRDAYPRWRKAPTPPAPVAQSTPEVSFTIRRDVGKSFAPMDLPPVGTVPLWPGQYEVAGFLDPNAPRASFEFTFDPLILPIPFNPGWRLELFAVGDTRAQTKVRVGERAPPALHPGLGDLVVGERPLVQRGKSVDNLIVLTERQMVRRGGVWVTSGEIAPPSPPSRSEIRL